MIQDRRHFLRGCGSLIALPALESLLFKRFASAKSGSAPPKRLIFLGIGYGVTAESWFPDTKQPGESYKLPSGLKPLSRHKNDFSIIQGCTHEKVHAAHWGSTYWLTGANRYGTPGSSFSNTISVDQVAANSWSKHTRYSSIQLCTHKAT